MVNWHYNSRDAPPHKKIFHVNQKTQFLLSFSCFSFVKTANAIDEESLRLLDPESTKDLIPKVGIRLKFLQRLNQFKKQVQLVIRV